MKGEDVKLKLKMMGVSITEISSKLGMSRQSLSQALSVKDVKTGLIEDLSNALDVPLSFFYDSGGNQHVIANGEKSVAALNSCVNTDNNASLRDEVISLRAENKLLREIQGLVPRK